MAIAADSAAGGHTLNAVSLKILGFYSASLCLLFAGTAATKTEAKHLMPWCDVSIHEWEFA